MRIRTVLAAAIVAATATLTLAGPASAAPFTDRDCRDFASQAAAQSALNSNSGDPGRLDVDDDGIACEEWFEHRQREVPPPPPHKPGHPKPDNDHAKDPKDRPVKTEPEHQVLVKPRGAPDTGDGSADTPLDATPAVLVVGALGAAVALGAGHRVARRTR
jgi:hypothetical protein